MGVLGSILSGIKVFGDDGYILDRALPSYHNIAENLLTADKAYCSPQHFENRYINTSRMYLGNMIRLTEEKT